jgi:hypothetical protein
MAQDDARPKRARTKKADSKPAAAAAAKRSRTAVPKSRKNATVPSADVVAVHAYLLWESGEPGDAVEHWLRAEQELAAA